MPSREALRAESSYRQKKYASPPIAPAVRMIATTAVSFDFITNPGMVTIACLTVHRRERSGHLGVGNANLRGAMDRVIQAIVAEQTTLVAPRPNLRAIREASPESLRPSDYQA